MGDDPAVHVALVQRLAEHLAQYARDYAEAAALEEPNWDARLVAARLALEPAPEWPADYPFGRDHCDACTREVRLEKEPLIDSATGLLCTQCARRLGARGEQ